IKINVPQNLRKIRVPALILQPLVENAVKHGVSKSKLGGTVEISARLETEMDKVFLKLKVTDTGAGVDFANLEKSRLEGLGLNNIEQRLVSYYGKLSVLKIVSTAGIGTTAEIKIPFSETDLSIFELQPRKM
ncbi:MAG TPA: ATP-binding protein, partial [Pyrinomonadaceae bacterium]|nr:ATP-binding protein [Pyrinomonadaceae bacterium]